MNRTVQQITQQLFDHLPENSQYYRLDELHAKEFPSFIVQRMQIEVERNLADSLVLPKTDWANIQSDKVQHAWQQFADAVRADVCLPADHAKSVIETAVADVLKMLVQPRKSIVDVVFGKDDELAYQEVCERVKAVVVYRHFEQIIPRYMQKRELSALSRERCSAIIANIDQKLTRKYSPLNWAQMLEPLFKLLNDKIDTNLLRLFFEDKSRPRIARRLDLMNDTLSRAQLIETLSSPDLLNFEGYEDDQSSLFEALPHMQQTQNFEKEKNSPLDDSPFNEGKSDKGQPSFEEPEEVEKEEEDNLKAGHSELVSDEDSAGEEEDNSINAAFAGDDLNDVVEAKGQNIFLRAEDSDEPKNGLNSEGRNGKTETNGKSVHETDDEVSSEGLSEETPMWMRFFEEGGSESSFADDKETDNRSAPAEENVDEDGFIDKPIIDITNRPQPFGEERKELLKLLSADQELFVEEIFGGSERAFDEAVEEIITFQNWHSASKFIEKEVFKRNLVNIYSEPAVNFTDRLQSYFLEKQNRK